MAKRKIHKPPTVGKLYKGKHKGILYNMTAVATKEGIQYRMSGRLFKTPTAAAKSITRFEVNGWKFWNMDES
jgi:hypothetical protein